MSLLCNVSIDRNVLLSINIGYISIITYIYMEWLCIHVHARRHTCCTLMTYHVIVLCPFLTRHLMTSQITYDMTLTLELNSLYEI